MRAFPVVAVPALGLPDAALRVRTVPRMRLALALPAVLVLAACSAQSALPSASSASSPVSPSVASSAPASPTPGAGAPVPSSSPSAEPAPLKRNKAHVNLPGNGSRPGVGVPVIVTFKYPVKSDADRAAIASRTRVTADDQSVAGGWWWASAREAHWRPFTYWPGKARVSFSLDTSGLMLGEYQGAAKPLLLDFTTAPKWTVWVNGRTQQMRVYKNSKRVEQFPISTGAPTTPTRNGTKLIMSRQTDYTMRGGDGADRYEVLAKYAMRLTWSGEFIHSAPWATYRLGRFGGSHGCTGMSVADSKWVYDNLPLYTPVKFTNLKGGPTDPENGLGTGMFPMRT